jgi:molecular chaperone HtpG
MIAESLYTETFLLSHTKMSISIEQTPLLKSLSKKSKIYYGKVLELRELISEWLTYTKQTFPHYTSHTIEHSERIIQQLSWLLFEAGDHKKAVINLSGVEIYVLIAAAYLHDSGMVASDKEKTEILDSQEWRKWISADGDGYPQWKEIQDFREGSEPKDNDIKNFLADVKLRYLISEFIRKKHHIRATSIIKLYENQLGRFAFNDSTLSSAISDICLAHGLHRSELADKMRFPYERLIRGEKANLRLLAILIRLGDLLDMSTDRACPVLLNAACPLPSNSYIHWSQYQRIRHFSISPQKIEIEARCENQMEHKTLQDWCQWIEDETSYANILMQQSTLHSNWRAPKAIIGTPESTINILPSETAKYIFSEWKFELDKDKVFERLISGVYSEKLSFIRELIQNAADANRCKLYVELSDNGIVTPENPTEIQALTIAEKYPIFVSIENKDIFDESLQRHIKKNIFTIRDVGIGMDKEVIEKYFLQIGCSFYQSADFKQNFKFTATSRFGIGFLTVFKVSNDVRIKTYKKSLTNKIGPISMRLSGPQNYILLEKEDDATEGTTIEITLEEELKPGELTRNIKEFCKRLEFPICIDDFGKQAIVKKEEFSQFCCEVSDFSSEKNKFIISAKSFKNRGVEGEIYLFNHITSHGVSLADWDWANNTYINEFPQAVIPKLPKNLICFHGIGQEQNTRETGYSIRADIRGDLDALTLSRENFNRDVLQYINCLVEKELIAIIKAHLMENSLCKSELWQYKQRLMRYFSIMEFWKCEKDTLQGYRNGQVIYLSLDEVLKENQITIILPPNFSYLYRPYKLPNIQSPCWANSNITLANSEIIELNQNYRKQLFKNKKVKAVEWLKSGHLSIDWENSDESQNFVSEASAVGGSFSLVVLPFDEIIVAPIHFTDGVILPHFLLNANHAFVKWLIVFKEACETQRYGFKQKHFSRITELLITPSRLEGYEVEKLNNYLKKISLFTDVPENLLPPSTNLDMQMFTFHSPLLTVSLRNR